MSKKLHIDVVTPVASPYHTPRLTSRKTPSGTPVGTPVGTPAGTPRGTKSTKIRPEEENVELSREEKREAILKEPKFGMLTMVRIFCREEKYSYVLLPISLLIGQWFVFFSVAAHNFTGAKQCGSSTLTMKMLFLGICLIYYVESIRLIDNLSRRVQSRKTTAEASYSVMFDKLHEDIFSLCIFIANLIIVFNTQNLLEAMFNCLAMQFLSELENQWQEAYYSTRLDEAVRVYDTVFVSANENAKKLLKKKKSALFRIIFKIASFTFGATYVAYRALPLFSITMLIVGILCK